MTAFSLSNHFFVTPFVVIASMRLLCVFGFPLSKARIHFGTSSGLRGSAKAIANLTTSNLLLLSRRFGLAESIAAIQLPTWKMLSSSLCLRRACCSKFSAIPIVAISCGLAWNNQAIRMLMNACARLSGHVPVRMTTETTARTNAITEDAEDKVKESCCISGSFIGSTPPALRSIVLSQERSPESNLPQKLAM